MPCGHHVVGAIPESHSWQGQQHSCCCSPSFNQHASTYRYPPTANASTVSTILCGENAPRAWRTARVKAVRLKRSPLDRLAMANAPHGPTLVLASSRLSPVRTNAGRSRGKLGGRSRCFSYAFVRRRVSLIVLPPIRGNTRSRWADSPTTRWPAGLLVGARHISEGLIPYST